MNRFRSMPFATRIFLLALIVRLVPVIAAIHLPIGLDDMFQYDMLARSIASGNGYRWYSQPDLDLIHSYVDLQFIGDYDPQGALTSFRPLGYPTFLALIYSISDLEWRLFAARLANAFLGATLAPMTARLAQRLFPKQPRAATFAAYTLALYPIMVIYPLALATENLFIPLVLAGLLVLLRAADTERDRDFLLAGAIFGVATLTRSVIFAFVGLAVLWIWFAARQRRGAFVFGLVLLALVLPWTIRNSLLHNRPTFVENSWGYNFHMGFHPEGTGTFQYGISLELLPYLDDGVRNEIGAQAGLDFIRQDPGRVPYLTIRKLGYFFGLERRALIYFYSNNYFGNIPALPLSLIFLLFVLPFPFIISLAALGLPFIEWNKQRFLLLLLIGAYLLPHLILIAEERFHLAILPILAVLAGYAWSERVQIIAAARAQRPKLALAFVLMGLLWLNWSLELWRDAGRLAILFGPDGNQAGFPY
ncbi:MAG: glycosyltransferase family 39 protein [Anaerolineales bacterium]